MIEKNENTNKIDMGLGYRVDDKQRWSRGISNKSYGDKIVPERMDTENLYDFANVKRFIQLGNVTTPRSPRTGAIRIYHKTAGSHSDLMVLDSSGNETELLNDDGSGNFAIDGDLTVTGTVDGVDVAGLEDQVQDGWVDDSSTWTYQSADAPTYSFTATGDQTAKYYAGMKIKLTQPTDGKKFFIVTKVDVLGPNTEIFVYGGANYDLDNEAITAPFYSFGKAPAGFPLNPDDWSEQFTDSTSRTQAAPVQNTWYNLGSEELELPIGIWDLSYQANIAFDDAAVGTALSVYSTLSTANNGESDIEFTSTIILTTSTANNKRLDGTVGRDKIIETLLKTTYYFNIKTTVAGVANIYVRNANSPLILRARCAYL